MNVPNTEEEDMFTQAFTTQNDPAAVATQAAQREYSRILGESRAQERTTQEAYSDMYAKMRQSAFRRQQAAPSRGFTGGMAAQQQATLSAAEMAEMGALGRSREQSLRDIRTGRLSAFSNSLIAGQQQADYSRMLQDASLARQSQIEKIITKAGDYKDYDDAAITRLLKSYGLSDKEIDNLLNVEKSKIPFTLFSNIDRTSGTKSSVKENYWDAVLGAQAGGFGVSRAPIAEEEDED